MFNFQFALLGEAVETDFQTVRTVRFKKSLRDGEHSHYKARIQLWRELDDDTEVLASVPSVAPTVTREAWQRPNIKVHTTRVVMYWDETTTTFFGMFLPTCSSCRSSYLMSRYSYGLGPSRITHTPLLRQNQAELPQDLSKSVNREGADLRIEGYTRRVPARQEGAIPG
jgi:hypothetical protein